MRCIHLLRAGVRTQSGWDCEKKAEMEDYLGTLDREAAWKMYICGK